MSTLHSGGRHFRQITALAIASTFLTQNFAWAVCSDGLGFSPGNQGYQFQLLPAALQNMSPGIFTGTAGSVFVPDNSIAENNDPPTARRPRRTPPALPDCQPERSPVITGRSTRARRPANKRILDRPASLPRVGSSRRTPRRIASFCPSSEGASSRTSAIFR